MLKLEEIIKIEDKEEAVFELFELIQHKFKNPEGFENLLNQYEKNVFLVEEMKREIFNGGVGQFFFNSSGDYTYEVLHALTEINATETKEILNEAINFFPKQPVPKDMEQRRELMHAQSEEENERWDDLSDKFYDCSEDTSALSIEYVKNNMAKFEL